MRVGFTSMNTPADLAPPALARELTDRGFHSWWIGEHSHIPVSRVSPYPAGGSMPEQYSRMMDPFLSLLAAATAAPALRVGLGVALVLEHHLLDLAKSIATLDVLTGGRLAVGVGVGWNAEELANHRPDIPWRQRYRAVAEACAALSVLWAQDQPEFHGEYFDFDRLWSYPKPAQLPRPPLLFGGSGPLAQHHAVAWADGWYPLDVALGDVPRRVQRFREATAAAGRAEIPITLGTFGDPSIATLHAYRELGVAEVVIGADRRGWDDPSTTLAYLDRYAGFIDELA